MSAANSTNAGTQRGWRQLSLRTLLVLVLFCAVGLLLWNIFVEPSRRQQRLVKQIEQKFVIHEDVAKKLPVTLNIRGLTTATTLEILLNNLDLHGLIRDDAIHIHPGPLPQDSP